MPFALKIHWLVRSIVEDCFWFSLHYCMPQTVFASNHASVLIVQHNLQRCDKRSRGRQNGIAGFSKVLCTTFCACAVDGWRAFPFAGQDAGALWKCYGNAQPLWSCDGGMSILIGVSSLPGQCEPNYWFCIQKACLGLFVVWWLGEFLQLLSKKRRRGYKQYHL